MWQAPAWATVPPALLLLRALSTVPAQGRLVPGHTVLFRLAGVMVVWQLAEQGRGSCPALRATALGAGGPRKCSAARG